jgi:signal transduction histidine kinase
MTDCYREPTMRYRIRNAAAIVILGLCLVLAIPTFFAVQQITAFQFGHQGSDVVVTWVDPDYYIQGDVTPGMVVSEFDMKPILEISPDQLDRYLQGYFKEVGFENANWGTLVWSIPEEVGTPSGSVFFIGLGLLLGIAIWVRRGQAGEALRPFAIPLAVASVTSLILSPAWPFLSWPMIVVGLVLSTLGLAVFADGFLERIPRRIPRLVAAGVAVAAAIGCVVVAVAQLPPASSYVPGARGVTLPGLPAGLAAAVTLVPAATLLLAGHARPGARMTVLLAAATPVVIATTHGLSFLGVGLTIPLLWLLVVAFLLQTNARADTMRVQRDAIVAAAERERARLAADLHDDALQGMTVLVRQLDETGDEASAELARSVAERMREVCGDLRLPILDELGAGAALEWLVDRVGVTSGRQVRLERDDGARPPAEVELAIFRVAQEALSNAVAHGAPPIVVRYTAAADRASLSITDQGLGIAADAASKAARSGHYGLLNMRQRAEQIGGRIDVRRPPSGGTSIGLSWSSP